ncbi:MAG: response regulator [Patescibacteria group bacterium]
MANKNNKNTILIVDDDTNLRTILFDKLTLDGFNVDSAHNGKEGLEKALATHPDLIILDVLMPVMNGWEMLRKLRLDDWGKNAKVTMLTVLEDADAIAQAMEGGSFNYLVKTNEGIADIVDNVKNTLEV